MGAIHLGPPEDLVLQLKAAGKYDLFVETGTWKAGTTRWAAQHFKRVETIEADENRYRLVTNRWAAQYPNVRWTLGDSADMLRRILRDVDEPAIFWLDAHHPWVGTDRPHLTECPLLDELGAIALHPLADQHVILIDDARLFNSPPPAPWTPARWPTRAQIDERLRGTHAIFEVEDAIVAVRPMLALVLAPYL